MLIMLLKSQFSMWKKPMMMSLSSSCQSEIRWISRTIWAVTLLYLVGYQHSEHSNVKTMLKTDQFHEQVQVSKAFHVPGRIISTLFPTEELLLNDALSISECMNTCSIYLLCIAFLFCCSHPPVSPLWLAHRWGSRLRLVLRLALRLALVLVPERQQPSVGCPQSL